MNEMLRNWTNDNSTDFSSSPNVVSSSVVFVLYAYATLLSCGNFLNLLVMYVMFRSHKICSSLSSFLIFHLSLTHVVFYLAVPLIRIYLHWCKASVLIELSCATAIFGSLAAIAWDRKRNVLQPFKSLVRRPLKAYLLLVACIWIYAFTTSTPFVFSVRSQLKNICWKENGTEKCREYTSCDSPIDWKTQLSKTLYFIMAFLAPFLYMLVTYTKVAVSLWKRSKSGRIHGAVAKKKARSIRLMITAVLVFAVCWGLNFITDLLRVYGVLDDMSFESDLLFQTWCLIAQALSSCLNPAVYAFFSPEFRRNCVKYCCCCFSCCVSLRRRYYYDENRVHPVL